MSKNPDQQHLPRKHNCHHYKNSRDLYLSNACPHNGKLVAYIGLAKKRASQTFVAGLGYRKTHGLHTDGHDSQRQTFFSFPYRRAQDCHKFQYDVFFIPELVADQGRDKKTKQKLKKYYNYNINFFNYFFQD